MRVLLAFQKCSRAGVANVSQYVLLQVLLSFHERFKSVVKQPDLKRKLQDASVKREVSSLLEALVGVIDASCYNNADVIFHFLHPLLVECCALLGQYIRRLFSTMFTVDLEFTEILFCTVYRYNALKYAPLSGDLLQICITVMKT